MENQNLNCLEKIVHHKNVAKTKHLIIDDIKIKNLAIFFKVFSDPTRLKILSALKNCELCVCDLMELLNMKQSTISQQLRILRQTRLVKFQHKGKQVFYALDDKHIHKIFDMGVEHINEEK